MVTVPANMAGILYDTNPPMKKISLFVLVAIIPLAYAPVFSNQHLPKILFLALLCLVAALDQLYQVRKSPQVNNTNLVSFISKHRISLLLAILTLFVFLSLVHVKNWMSAQERAAYWGLLCCLYFVSYRVMKKYSIDVFAALVVGGAIAACYGIYQSFFPIGHEFSVANLTQQISPVTKGAYPGYVSSFGNVNFAATYMTLTILLAWFHYRETSLKVTVLRLIASALAFFYLMRTGSRAAWIALAIGFLCYTIFWYKIGHRIKKKRLALFFAILSLVVMAPFMDGKLRKTVAIRLHELTNWQGGSTKVRLAIWRSTIAMIKEHPFLGAGIGQFSHCFFRYRYPDEYLLSDGRLVEHPHNSFMLIAAELGIPAALIAAFLFFYIIQRLYRLMNIGSQSQKQQALCLLSAFLALSFITLVSAPLLSPATGIFFVLIAVWSDVQFASPEKNVGFSRWNKYWSYFSLLVAIAISYLFLIHSIGDCYFNSGQKLLKKRDYSGAVKKLRQCLSWYPSDFYRLEYGRALLASGHLAQSQKNLIRVMSVSPELEAAYIDTGLCYLGQKKIFDALKIWHKAYALFPMSKVLNYNLARIMIIQNSPYEALRYLKTLELFHTESKKEFQFLLDLGDVYYLLKNVRKSLFYYIRAKEVNQKNALPYLKIGNIMYELGLTSSAVLQFRQAIRLAHPKQKAEAYCQLGRIAQVGKQQQLAVTYYLQARQQDRQSSMPYLYLAQIAAQRKKFTLAKKYLQHAKELGFQAWKTLLKDAFFHPLTSSGVYQKFK